MGKRKVTILEQAAISVAEVAFFIEAKGMPLTAKKILMTYLISSIQYLLIPPTINFVVINDGKN